MSGIYQKQTDSRSVTSPAAGSTLISVNESGELFTKDSSGNIIVYPTSSAGGGGGSPFPFTGSADISGTLNVNYSDTFTFGVDENVSQSITEYIDDFGGWITLPFTGTAIGGKLDFANNEIYNNIQVGNASIPGIPAPPTPGALSGQLIKVNDGILSGSTSRGGITLFDQTGLGGDVSIQNGFNTIINNTLSGSNISYNVDTSFSQNDEFSDLSFGKTNEAGETIDLNFNDGATGLNLFSDLTDAGANIFRIVDTSDDFANLFSIDKGGPDIYSGQFGFQINQPSSSFTNNLFSVYDSDDNNLFRIQPGGPDIYSSQYGFQINQPSSSFTASLFSVYAGKNNLFNIQPGGPNIYSGQYGFQVAQPSSAFTESLFSVRDVDDNILLETNAHISGSFNSQVDIPHDGKSDILFRVLSSNRLTNYLQVDASGSTTIESTSSGSGGPIFNVGNGGRTALEINDINSTTLNDINLYLSDSLPTSAAGLSAGQVYTQTAAELGGSGATKVLCIV